MSCVRIAPIVEGHGEVQAVPLLIRRIAAEVDFNLTVVVEPPIRVPANRLRKLGELERTVELAARKLGGAGGILVLIDCDWDRGCPKWDGPARLHRARAARPDMPVALVLAYREYEAWFIAAAESIQGRRGLAETLEMITDPEGIRGAKEWLSSRMPRNRPYTETTDQPALTQWFDMQAARRANSFDKCYREIVGLLNRLRAEAS
ncbi:MAG: DUF4276 family protein [Candidatus Competibacteraceae bacterium]